jgi:hypothetical protein
MYIKKTCFKKKWNLSKNDKNDYFINSYAFCCHGYLYLQQCEKIVSINKRGLTNFKLYIFFFFLFSCVDTCCESNCCEYYVKDYYKSNQFIVDHMNITSLQILNGSTLQMINYKYCFNYVN